MVWRDGEKLSRVLETLFKQILLQRMRGLPVLNQALSVQAVGFRQIDNEWLGVLLTPWFMNLLLLPGLESTWLVQNPGTKFDKAFPYGVFEFTVAKEEPLGVYGQCSLFSPMFQFSDQADALAAAQAALQGLLQAAQPSSLSRRNLLLGRLAATESGE